jgi:hypothetical protein
MTIVQFACVEATRWGRDRMIQRQWPSMNACLTCKHWDSDDLTWGRCRAAEKVWSLVKPVQFHTDIAAQLNTHARFHCQAFEVHPDEPSSRDAAVERKPVA